MKSIIVRRYKSQAIYQLDARRLAKQGYAVTDVTSEQPRAGCLRILTIGVFAWLFKPKPVLVVTYVLKRA